MLYLRKKEKRIPYLFILPGMLVILLVFFYPVAKIVYDSFYQISGTRREFMGMNNYGQLLGDNLFWTSVLNNFKLLLCVPVLTALSLVFSILLFFKIPGWKVYRVLILVPYILSITVVGIVFDYILREDGLLNLLLRNIGLGGLSQPWLGDQKTALFAIMAVVIWKEMGFGIVLFLARMLSIDESVLEAARLDGAGVLALTRRIFIPELKEVLSFYLILTTINMLSWMFNYVFVMTRGGPVNSTYIMEYYIYQLGIRYKQYGLSSALAVILLVIALVLGIIQVAVRKSVMGEEGEE